MDSDRPKITRGEWTSIMALLLAGGSVVFTGGIMSGRVDSTERRVTSLEKKADEQSLIVTRVDANVTFLADRAREDRENMERRAAR
jgi:hypothetical protein